jgi:hypothetical protein
MYLTNQSFYHTYLSHMSAPELLPVIETLTTLIITYGRHKLQHPAFLQCIKKQSPTLFTLLSLLDTHHMLTQKNIKRLKNMIQKKASQIQTKVLIVSPSQTINTTLEKQLKKVLKTSLRSHDVDISLLQTPDIGLKVQSNDVSYERNLEKDITLLLSLQDVERQ